MLARPREYTSFCFNTGKSLTIMFHFGAFIAASPPKSNAVQDPCQFELYIRPHVQRLAANTKSRMIRDLEIAEESVHRQRPGSDGSAASYRAAI